jgi:hypothetical protein
MQRRLPRRFSTLYSLYVAVIAKRKTKNAVSITFMGWVAKLEGWVAKYGGMGG